MYATRLAQVVLALLLVNGVVHADEFKPIDITKGNQRELSKDYFAIEVGKGEHDCLLFTVHVKANPVDRQVRSGFARLELIENDGRVAWIPIERKDKADGGHIITFELSRELAAKSTLVLVHLTTEAGGNVYRINLCSYTEDARKHEGIWKPIAAVLSGVRLPDDAVKAITVRNTDGNYEVTVEGEEESDKGTYTLDTTTTPHRMTIKSTAGPNRGKIFLAIYEMKDDVSMRVCYDLSGTDFPKDFRAPKGSQLYVVGYRRQKAEQAEKTHPQ